MTALADRAWELLADDVSPQDAVRQLTPTTKSEAVHLARRLPMLHERPGNDRGAAIVRLAARIGMKRFRLKLEADGRVIDDRRHHHTPGPEYTFPTDGGTVTHTPRYVLDKDHFRFLGHPEPGPWEIPPRSPLPLSGGGDWSHFAEPDAVIAMGGPEAYAALTAVGRDGWQAFDQPFTDKESEPVQAKRQLVVGTHTERVVNPPEPKALPDGPPDLFTGMEGRNR